MTLIEELSNQIGELKRKISDDSATRQINTALNIAAPEGLPPLVRRFAHAELKEPVSDGFDAEIAVRGFLQDDAIQALIDPTPEPHQPSTPPEVTSADLPKSRNLSTILSEIQDGSAILRKAS